MAAAAGIGSVDGGAGAPAVSAAAKKAALKVAAEKRLMRDYKELVLEPILGIACEPLDGNLFEWHGNISPLSGKYTAAVFHIILKFPHNYPLSPPTVNLCTAIPHPNVFGTVGAEQPYICLDLLKEHTATEQYTGWSSAYSVASIMMQLSAFLFDENVPQSAYALSNDAPHLHIERAKGASSLYECKTCPHRGRLKPYPKVNLPATAAPRIAAVSASAVSYGSKRLPTQSRLLGAATTADAKSTPAASTVASTVAGTAASTPTAEELMASAAAVTSQERTDALSGSGFRRIDAYVIRLIFELLLFPELSRVKLTCRYFARVLQQSQIVARRQLVCFHSKASFDTELLGIGITPSYYPGSSDKKRLNTIRTCLDVLSYSAFNDAGVRHGVWKEPFELFFPLLINEKHGERAFKMIETAIARILNPPAPEPAPIISHSALDAFGPPLSASIAASISLLPPRLIPPPASIDAEFRPVHALKVLCTLMNSMVVDLMKTAEGEGNGDAVETDRRRRMALVQLYANLGLRADMPPPAPGLSEGPAVHASERALQGYCAFHHMLLAFAVRYPELTRMANARVNRFLYQNERNKRAVPNLGEFIVLLTLTDLSWTDLAIPIIIESWDREVKWQLQRMPELALDPARESPSDMRPMCYRLRASFAFALTSKRLLMFQTYFLRAVRGAPADLLKKYNRNYGRPEPHMVSGLQEACKQIMSIYDYDSFFDFVGVRRLPYPQLFSMLCTAIGNSSKKGYHVSSDVKSNLRKQECLCEYVDQMPVHYRGELLCRFQNPDLYDKLKSNAVEMKILSERRNTLHYLIEEHTNPMYTTGHAALASAGLPTETAPAPAPAAAAAEDEPEADTAATASSDSAPAAASAATPSAPMSSSARKRERHRKKKAHTADALSGSFDWFARGDQPPPPAARSGKADAPIVLTEDREVIRERELAEQKSKESDAAAKAKAAAAAAAALAAVEEKKKKAAADATAATAAAAAAERKSNAVATAAAAKRTPEVVAAKGVADTKTSAAERELKALNDRSVVLIEFEQRTNATTHDLTGATYNTRVKVAAAAVNAPSAAAAVVPAIQAPINLALDAKSEPEPERATINPLSDTLSAQSDALADEREQLQWANKVPPRPAHHYGSHSHSNSFGAPGGYGNGSGMGGNGYQSFGPGAAAFVGAAFAANAAANAGTGTGASAVTVGGYSQNPYAGGGGSGGYRRNNYGGSNGSSSGGGGGYRNGGYRSGGGGYRNSSYDGGDGTGESTDENGGGSYAGDGSGSAPYNPYAQQLPSTYHRSGGRGGRRGGGGGGGYRSRDGGAGGGGGGGNYRGQYPAYRQQQQQQQMWSQPQQQQQQPLQWGGMAPNGMFYAPQPAASPPLPLGGDDASGTTTSTIPVATANAQPLAAGEPRSYREYLSSTAAAAAAAGAPANVPAVMSAPFPSFQPQANAFQHQQFMQHRAAAAVQFFMQQPPQQQLLPPPAPMRSAFYPSMPVPLPLPLPNALPGAGALGTASAEDAVYHPPVKQHVNSSGSGAAAGGDASKPAAIGSPSRTPLISASIAASVPASNGSGSGGAAVAAPGTPSKAITQPVKKYT